MARYTLTQTNKGMTLSVKVKDEIVIMLGENPSTGFLWTVYAYDPNILTMADLPSPPSPSAGIGAGGTRVFSFIAVAAGNTTIGLKYWRGFEPDDQVLKYEVNVLVGVSSTGV